MAKIIQTAYFRGRRQPLEAIEREVDAESDIYYWSSLGIARMQRRDWQSSSEISILLGRGFAGKDTY